ncbi:NADH-quinone oxidoreductase subunit N [Mycobacterium kubicae]|nr:NADH-quinone oxidoreductase subunit N [Mycobacterium kubicae]MCV7093574.1 NADH-quinone oxidoreductase subunit N [Mycobacterium kubicae]ORW02302.1 NADH-quinone oxidoreductase subunit N [Mycobacterium kubicae]QNI14895.1 NADH-quinone oxidoreductase subunit N [Mycobacterium kubicae]QPI40807.1 NADH-quinone oxidoreductase subunit N [Mycobacterium kubicae]
MRPLLMLPEMLLFGGGLVVLIAGSFLPRQRLSWTRGITATVLAAACVAAAVGMAGSDQAAFDGTFAGDHITAVSRIVAATGALLVVLVAGGEIGGSAREAETYALVLFSTTGTVIVAAADDMLVLATGFLLAGIPLYGLIGMRQHPNAAEAAMKTYLLGALFSIMLLLGITILYGLTGSTRYDHLASALGGAPFPAVVTGVVAVIGGLMFEAGGVPAHFWVPDAAQGTSGSAAMFLTTVPKVGAVAAIYRVSTILPAATNWSLLISVFAVASMTLGNLAAYGQQDPRRLLGWSTVSQVGFLLVPITVLGRSELALPSLLFYLAGYTLTNCAAFAVSTALPDRRSLTSYRGLARGRPWLAGALVVALLGLVGTPPTAVFVGKLTTAIAAWDGGFPWLAVAVFVNSLISLFYYLRWIIPSFQVPLAGKTIDRFPAEKWSARVAVTAAGLSVVLGVAAGAVWPLLA